MPVRRISAGGGIERKLADMARKLDGASSVRIGILEGATYPDGTPVALVAAVQEFGAPSRGIPPRPFFRNMVAAKSKDWPAAMAKLIEANGYDAQKVLSLMGEGIAGQLRESISTFKGAPLAPATIKRKGFDKQLVSSGHLLASVDYEVK